MLLSLPISSLRLPILLSLLLAWAMPLHAEQEFCGADAPHPIDVTLDAAMERSDGVTVDMREAQSIAYAAWDAELNSNYRQLMDATTGKDRLALRAAQRAWLAFHTAESDWLLTDSMHGDEGSSASLALASLALDRLRERVCFLVGYRSHLEGSAPEADNSG